MTREKYLEFSARALALYEKAGIVLTEKECEDLEIADFGLGEFERTGLAVVTYVNTSRVCAKELVMLPNQTCPEHIHPDLSETTFGKEETFRCRWGIVYLYVPGEPIGKSLLKAIIPAGSEENYTVFHEIVLHPGDQYTLYPNTKHWFQSGDQGAVISEFSTTSTDENDIFTDPRIIRIPVIE